MDALPTFSVDVRALEAAALQAWPALETVSYDGWLLRFAKGYTKRANSVNPLDTSTCDIAEKIAVCEQAYAERNLPVIFRITPLASPADLDDVLAARGYRRLDTTLVLGRDLAQPLPAPNPAPSPAELHLRGVAAWLAAYARCSGRLLPPVHRTILEAIGEGRRLLTLEVAGEAVSCALAVFAPPWAGIYSVVTDRARRRHGYGRQMMAALLHEARAGGLRVAYLQVEETNTPARCLYAQLGFTELYRYWYRVRGT